MNSKTKKRIKTNIVELSRFKKTPSDYWLGKFQDGKLDVHEAFKEHEDYQWLYEDSDYDLVGWEIENNCFDWENNSWVIPVFLPEHFDAEKYNWKKYSWLIAKYCPEKIDPEKFNWEDCSWAVVKYCPEKIDVEKFNWEDFGDEAEGFIILVKKLIKKKINK